jgi:fibronectin-binding autotransporter adhesin
MNGFTRFCKLGLPLVVSVAMAAWSIVGHAQTTRTWSSSPTSGDWTVAGNWASGTAPVANDSLAFGSTTVTTATNNFTAGTQFNGITFNSGAATYTLSGNQITLGGSVTNNSTNAQTISLPIALSATRTFNAATGALTLSGSISGGGGLTKSGTSTLTLSGGAANTSTGLTTVSAGVLSLAKTAGLNAIAGDLTITNAAVTFTNSNQIADTAAVTMSGSSSVFNGTSFNSGAAGNQALNETIGSLAVTGGIFFPGGSTSATGFAVTGSASFTGGSGNTNYIQGSGGLASYGSLALVGMNSTQPAGFGVAVPNQFAVAGNNTSRQTTLTVGAGGLLLDGSNLLLQLGNTAGVLGSRLVLNGDVTTTGVAASSISVPSTNDFSLGTRAVQLSGTTGSVTRTFTVGGGGADLTVSVPITNGSATTAGLSKAGVGTLTLSASNSYTGTTTIKTGTLALGSVGSFANSPTITIGDAGSSGAVLDLTAKTGTFAFTSGQTVGGIGTINIGAGKTVSSAGIWAPGNSIGSNAVTGNLTLTGTSQFELGTPGTSTSAPGSADFTAVSGTLTLGGNLQLIDNAGANGNGSAAGGVYRLFTYGNAVSGSFASATTNPTPTTRTSLSNISYAGSGTATGNGVFLSVYNLAAAGISSGTSLNLGTVLKNTSLSQALSISNTAAVGSYSEKLDAAFGSLTGEATTNAVSISLLAAGGTSTAMSVGLPSATAGNKTGAVQIGFTSNGDGTSGLGTASLGSQTVSLTATVLDPAVASFASGSTSTSLTLNFGSVNEGDSVSPLGFSLSNLLQTAGFTADLALVQIDQTNPSGPLSSNLSLFNSLVSGTFNSWQASVNTATQGTFGNIWTLQFKSSNGGTVYNADTPQTLTLTANVIVVPEPGALALAGIGIALAAYTLRRRT